MRSRPLENLLCGISEINKYVTVSLFIEHQFFVDNDSKIKENEDSYTSKIFKNNRYSTKHNVELVNLYEDAHMYENYLMSTSYVFLYSLFEIYIKELGKYTNRIRKDNFTVDKNFSIRDLFHKVGKEYEKIFAEEFIKTVKYIRLRRNTHVHSDGRPSECLKKLMRYKGGDINEYWTKRMDNGLMSLDFGDFSTDEFSFDELVDLIRIMRRVSSQIDKRVLETVGKEKILEYLYELFKSKKSKEIDDWGRHKVKRKFSGFVEREMGIPRKQFEADIIDNLGA